MMMDLVSKSGISISRKNQTNFIFTNYFTLYKNQMFDVTARNTSPWVLINANNKMIARLSALRYILNTLEYKDKKTLEPPKWGEDLGAYSCYIEGVLFDNLTYEQYKILAPFSD